MGRVRTRVDGGLGFYYRMLLAVSEKSDWTGWCVFFLEAVRAQAAANTHKANAIMDLYEKMKAAIPKLVNSQYLLRILDGIFRTPIFTGSGFPKGTGIPTATATRILPLLVKNDILKVIAPARGNRSATYAFPQLLNLAEGKQVFWKGPGGRRNLRWVERAACDVLKLGRIECSM